jgi:hypothetical protein
MALDGRLTALRFQVGNPAFSFAGSATSALAEKPSSGSLQERKRPRQ